jgi:hypothetical protein
MARKKAVPFAGKETVAEEEAEHRAIQRAGGDVATATRRKSKRRVRHGRRR